MKVIQAADVPKLIKDGDNVLIPGTTGCYPEHATVEIEKSFLETGHPAHLTLHFQSAMGTMGHPTRGLSNLCHEGLFDVAYCGHINGCGRKMTEFVRDNGAEVYNMPQGVTLQLMKCTAAHTPGFITKIGLKTFMDPRQDCARMNSRSTKSPVELIEIDGEEWLFYRAPKKIDVALIRGTYADEKGHIYMDNEGYKMNTLDAAAAAKATGGIVIAQVERIIKAGFKNPKEVEVPGFLVDYAFCADMHWHMQTSATQFNPVFTGAIKVPLDSIPPIKLDSKKVMSRRAAMELEKDVIVNLGVGTPTFMANVCAEEGCSDYFTLTSETGAIGGIPGAGNDFGTAWNGEAMIQTCDINMIYDGGILDKGYLGFLQVAPNGDVNSANRNGLAMGIGGFMNVAGGAKHVIFMGMMTAGGYKNEIGDGKLTITNEGAEKKFVNKVHQVCFSGEVALDLGKKVTYVTERCVFQLTREGLMLTEIAPGVDLQKDILDQMEFKPLIAEDLKLMPAELFCEKWGGLKAYLDAKLAE